MTATLLFLPDISGFTKFVQSTEVSHSQHIVAELLELLIASNNIDLELAEVEGDALFFYKEDPLPTKEQLEAQIEKMMTVFYSHLQQLQKNRICPCQACITAPELDLKIIAHCGEVQFMTVQEKRKPFGPEVIQAHRLMKNSVQSDRYLLLSQSLASELAFFEDQNHQWRKFDSGKDTYDDVEVDYFHHHLEKDSLTLIPHADAITVDLKSPPTLSIRKTFKVSANRALEYVTNYAERPNWTDGLDTLEYNQDEVTRIGTEHTCVINAKRLNFTTITKAGDENQLVYGELTTSVAPLDRLYSFYIFTPIDESTCEFEFQSYLQMDSFIKKPLLFLMKPMFKKMMAQGLELLEQYIEKDSTEDSGS